MKVAYSPIKFTGFVSILLALWNSGVIAADAEQSSLVADVNSGAEIYNSVCNGCHGVSIAPTLRGIIDRPIASVESFAGYSDALRAKQSMTWSKKNLSAFLAAPTEFAPGTLMIQVIPDAQKRADIIGFLEKLPPPRK
jgi:cytochrome c